MKTTTKKTITNITIGIIIIIITAIAINGFTDYKIAKAIETYEETTTKTINFK